MQQYAEYVIVIRVPVDRINTIQTQSMLSIGKKRMNIGEKKIKIIICDVRHGRPIGRSR